MRTPVGSSKMSARSVAQKSPVRAPTGVILTFCACAADTNAISVRRSIAIWHLRVIMVSLLYLASGPTGQAIVGTPLRGLFDGYLAGPPTLISFSSTCRQRRQSVCSDERGFYDRCVERRSGPTSRIDIHHA